MPKDAIDLLVADHAEAKKLFEKVADPEHEDRAEDWTKLATALKAHVAVEQEVFYPRIVAELGDDIPEDVIEHQEVEETEGTAMLEELVDMGVEHEQFDEMFNEFKDITLEHAVEVEEGKLFPIVRQRMSKADLERLGRDMERRKAELTQEAQAQAR